MNTFITGEYGCHSLTHWNIFITEIVTVLLVHVCQVCRLLFVTWTYNYRTWKPIPHGCSTSYFKLTIYLSTVILLVCAHIILGLQVVSFFRTIFARHKPVPAQVWHTSWLMELHYNWWWCFISVPSDGRPAGWVGSSCKISCDINNRLDLSALSPSLSLCVCVLVSLGEWAFCSEGASY